MGDSRACGRSGQREYYSKCCSFGHVDRTREGRGDKSGFDRIQRHVTTRGCRTALRCAFRGRQVPPTRSRENRGIFRFAGRGRGIEGSRRLGRRRRKILSRIFFSLGSLSVRSLSDSEGKNLLVERTRKKKLRGYFKMNSFGEFCYIVCANKRQRLK